MPAGQVLQLVRELVSCFPAAQVMHELEPALGWCLPAAHALHEVLVWLEDDWYCPAAHEEQPLHINRTREVPPHTCQIRYTSERHGGQHGIK